MAIVSVSLDTVTRKAVLTINGILVPSTEFHMSQYEMDNGLDLSFSYTIDNVDGHGMQERRSFSLPSSAEAIATESSVEVNENGLISGIVHNDDKARADVIDFLNRRRNS